MGEDASRVRKGHAPANNAILDNIALAVVFHRGFRYLPEANLHFMMRRRDALDAILPRTETPPTAVFETPTGVHPRAPEPASASVRAHPRHVSPPAGIPGAPCTSHGARNAASPSSDP